MKDREFTAIYQKRGSAYIAWIEEIPGVNTQGRTKVEARENLKEALQMVLEANRKLAGVGRLPHTTREPLRLPLMA